VLGPGPSMKKASICIATVAALIGTRAFASDFGNVDEMIPSEALASSPLKDAKFYLERGIALYRNGDLPAAIADFDLAIQLDPNLEDAYINQGIAWYRMGSFDRAFADVAQAIRIENSYQIATPPLPRVSPLSH
jgi:tetratricopeptide (TPR) repeat protein